MPPLPRSTLLLPRARQPTLSLRLRPLGTPRWSRQTFFTLLFIPLPPSPPTPPRPASLDPLIFFFSFQRNAVATNVTSAVSYHPWGIQLIMEAVPVGISRPFRGSRRKYDIRTDKKCTTPNMKCLRQEILNISTLVTIKLFLRIVETVIRHYL